jgi:hypothetical protein
VSGKRGPGRPPNEDGLRIERDAAGNIIKVVVSQEENWAELACQVKERKMRAREDGKKLTTKKAVQEEIIKAIKDNNLLSPESRSRKWKMVDPGLLDVLMDTAYTKVRKLLKKQKLAGEKKTAADRAASAR